VAVASAHSRFVTRTTILTLLFNQTTTALQMRLRALDPGDYLSKCKIPTLGEVFSKPPAWFRRLQ